MGGSSLLEPGWLALSRRCRSLLESCQRCKRENVCRAPSIGMYEWPWDKGGALDWGLFSPPYCYLGDKFQVQVTLR